MAGELCNGICGSKESWEALEDQAVVVGMKVQVLDGMVKGRDGVVVESDAVGNEGEGVGG